MNNKYRYRDLDPGHIRLIQIYTSGQDLYCVIEHFDLEGAGPQSPVDLPEVGKIPQGAVPSYIALSHHWDPKPKSIAEQPVLLIQEGNDLFELPVRQGVREALEAVRAKISEDVTSGQSISEWPRYVWIDAVCINQRSDDDKKHQLRRMGDIYNTAKHVVVWLGQMSEVDRMALRCIKDLQDEDNLQEYVDDLEHKPDWAALAKFLQKPWFTRLWIVQEICAARKAKILIGSEEIDWEEFATAISLLIYQREDVKAMLAPKDKDPFGEINASGASILIGLKASVLGKKANGDIGEHKMTLERLITHLTNFKVSESHDTIFAILWLSSDASEGIRNTPRGANRNTIISPNLQSGLRVFNEPEKFSESPITIVVSNTSGHLVPPEPDRSQSLRRQGHRRNSLSKEFVGLAAVQVEQILAAKELRDTGIVVDYAQSVYDLCRDVLLHIIALTKRLDIICFRWAPPPREANLSAQPPRPDHEPDHPTWLLHTRLLGYPAQKDNVDRKYKALGPVRRQRADPFVGKPGSGHRPYSAAGLCRAYTVLIENRILNVQGWPILVVEKALYPANNAIIPAAWFRTLGWTDGYAQPPDHVWQLLIGNKGKGSLANEPPPHSKLMCFWACSQDIIAGDNCDLTYIRNNGKVAGCMKDYLDVAIATVWNRQLFTGICSNRSCDCGSPFFGLSSEDTQQGDIICILLGCSVPVILRPAPQVDGVVSSPLKRKRPVHHLKVDTVRTAPPLDYQFVGECYLHGMMNGEVFNYVDHHNIKLQDIYIE